MKILFCDLEYATSKGGSAKICEFGFVRTDEKFNIIEKSNFIINPNISYRDWDWYVVKKILTRKKDEYLKSPTFDFYYDRIKELIERSDFVIGHSLRGDAKALNGELQRYHLPAINYAFYEVNQFYKSYANAKRTVSVVDMLKEMNLDGDDHRHDAEGDAYNVMIELKEMTDKLEVSLPELIDLSDITPDTSYEYKFETTKKAKLRREEMEDDSND